MNHEPIQFLPVTPFWKQAERAQRKSAWAFVFGVIAGTVGTLLAALLTSYLLSAINY